MPVVQNTFVVVPNALGFSTGARSPDGRQTKPPMTSKQAKKLYKQANKGPRLSKAEQRRIELEEQARIRREFEETKLLAAKERKKQKQREKEQQKGQQQKEKRKKGLPLVQVRPSQDTIARFVRGNGAGKRKAPLKALPEEIEGGSDKENEATKIETPSNDVEEVPEPKRQRTGWNSFQTRDPQEPRRDGLEHQSSRVDRLSNNIAADTRNRPLTEAIAATNGSFNSSKPAHHASSCMGKSAPQMPLQETSVNTSRHLLSRPASDLPKTQASAHTPSGRSASGQKPASAGPLTSADSPVSRRLPVSKRPSASMGPPVSRRLSVSPALPAPAATAPGLLPTVASGSSGRPMSLPRHLHTPTFSGLDGVKERPRRTGLEDMAPPSTQFVLNHLDDLFPTPSQQALELLEDDPVPPEPTTISTMPFFSTQDFVLSSQDIREFEGTVAPTRVVNDSIHTSLPRIPNGKILTEPSSRHTGVTLQSEGTAASSQRDAPWKSRGNQDGRSIPKSAQLLSSQSGANGIASSRSQCRSCPPPSPARPQTGQLRSGDEQLEEQEVEERRDVHGWGGAMAGPRRSQRQALRSPASRPMTGQLSSTTARNTVTATVAYDKTQVISQSQETDYGDLDLGDGNDLDLLEQGNGHILEDELWDDIIEALS